MREILQSQRKVYLNDILIQLLTWSIPMDPKHSIIKGLHCTQINCLNVVTDEQENT